MNSIDINGTPSHPQTIEVNGAEFPVVKYLGWNARVMREMAIVKTAWEDKLAVKGRSPHGHDRPWRFWVGRWPLWARAKAATKSECEPCPRCGKPVFKDMPICTAHES